MKWEKAPDIQDQIEDLAFKLEDFAHIRPERIFCYRSTEAKTRAIARIWSFPKVFQEALEIEAAYVLEVVWEKYKKLSQKEQTKVLIHELLHVPRNFSGSLLPHKYGYKRIDKEVERIFKLLNE